MDKIHPKSRSFQGRICSQTQDLQIFKKFNMLSSTTLHSRSLPLKTKIFLIGEIRMESDNFLRQGPKNLIMQRSIRKAHS